MKGNRAAITAVVIIVLLVVGWWLFRRDGNGKAVDLISQFESTTKQPSPDRFTVADVSLNGDSKRAIAIVPSTGTRLTWKITVPDDGWLSVAVGLKPEAWTKPGDGVKFHVGVSDGRTYEELFSQHVDPFNNAGDRRWIPVMVDLSAYAGEQIELKFNTNSSMPTNPPKDNQDNDLALWGEPRIVVR